MSELFTIDEIEKHLREEVAEAGGAKKWCRKHKIDMSHAIHMVENGSAASLDRVLYALGLRQVIRYEPIAPAKTTTGDNA
jgi:hypothetical protein